MKKIYIIPSGIDKDTVLSFIGESSNRLQYILRRAFEIYGGEGFVLFNNNDWTYSSQGYLHTHMEDYSRKGYEILVCTRNFIGVL